VGDYPRGDSADLDVRGQSGPAARVEGTDGRRGWRHVTKPLGLGGRFG
jgi:hypothetical protein